MKQCRFFAMLLFAATLAFSSCGGGGSGDGDSANDVVFLSAVQTGGTSLTADSTGLTLTFDVDPSTLTADHITVTGATKGALSGSGTTRSLAISNLTVADGANVSVTISSPSGYSISGSPKTITVYRLLAVGVPYQGGVIAYILQNGDPGYVDGQTHGIIAATSDQSDGIIWAVAAKQSTAVSGGTGEALGTGSSNTDNIIDQNDAGTTYAAGIARAYSGGGYTDWYLPSSYELHKLYLNKAAVGGFADSVYWSSTEGGFMGGPGTAYCENFNGVGGGVCNNKNSTFCVRAVRSF